MGEPRTSARPWYDVVLELRPERPAPGTQKVFGLVKFTYEVRGQQLEYAEAEPLADPIPGEDPPIPPGSDFWPEKLMTDLVVQGSAFAPPGREVTRSEVHLDVGSWRRSIAVLGDREILWQESGNPRIGSPAPFEEIPLTWDHAYGGIDDRTPVPYPQTVEDILQLQYDHPGLYPRNPFGRGYLIEPEPSDDAVMPNLEDPDDLLTEERLITRDPRRWYLQPIPACFDFMSVGAFPRKVWMHSDSEPWHPAPEDASLPEIRRGFLVEGYRSLMRTPGHPSPDPRFFQGGSHGLVLRELAPGTPIQVSGMHPEHPTVRFTTPAPPPMRLWGDGKVLEAVTRLHHLVFRPGELKVTMVYGLSAASPRTFIPGVHGQIPIFLQVGDDEAVPFETPPTLKAQLAEAEAEAEAEREREAAEQAAAGEAATGEADEGARSGGETDTGPSDSAPY